MTRNEAIKLLANCRQLAAKLVQQGLETELTTPDRSALAEFNRVVEDGWLENQTIYRQAGLRAADIGVLNLISTQVRAEETRRHQEMIERCIGSYSC